MDKLAILAPVLGVVALLFAFYLSRKVSKQDAGTDRMKEIAAFIHEGAQAFLMAEYKILVIFVAVRIVIRCRKNGKGCRFSLKRRKNAGEDNHPEAE